MNLSPPPSIQGRKITSHRLVHQRARLLLIRSALLRQIKRLAEDALEDTPGYSIHMADAGTDSFDRDLILGLASFEHEALYEVDAALQRIDDGTYGICEVTGQLIPWKRLEAIPWTRFSIEAEVQLEILGTNPHIGSLRTVQPGGEESFQAPIDLQGQSLSGGSTEHRASRPVSEKNVS